MSVFPTHTGFWWGNSRGYHNGCCSGVCLQRLHPVPLLNLHLVFALGNHLQLPIPGAAHFTLYHVPPSRNSAEDRRKAASETPTLSFLEPNYTQSVLEKVHSGASGL